MKVEQIMTPRPRSVRMDANLAEAAKVMWDGNCGIVPVVNAEGGLEAVVTDRDVCIAAATRNRAPAAIRVSELAVQTRHPVITCGAEEDVREALTAMRTHHVRRLPVMRNGRLVGIVSLRDIAHVASGGRGAEVSFEDVATALQAVSRPRPEPVPETVAV